MLGEFVRLEWERRRGTLLAYTAVAALVPVVWFVSVGLGGRRGDLQSGLFTAEVTGILLVAALWIAAMLWGSGAWRDERRGDWVYALALPLSRVHLFAMRYLAGLVWLLVPVAVLGASATVVAGLAALPAGMYAYPAAFTRAAAVAMWLLYTAMFVLAARFERPWVIVSFAALAYVLFNLSFSLGTFPTLARVAEAVNHGALSPLRPLRESPSLFGF